MTDLDDLDDDAWAEKYQPSGAVVRFIVLAITAALVFWAAFAIAEYFLRNQ